MPALRSRLKFVLGRRLKNTNTDPLECCRHHIPWTHRGSLKSTSNVPAKISWAPQGTNAQTCLHLHTSAGIHTCSACTYARTHAHARARTHIHTHARMDGHTHARVHACMQTSMHVRAHTHARMHSRAHACTHGRTHAHTRTQERTHISMHAHTAQCPHVCVAQNHRYRAIFGTKIPPELDRTNFPTLFLPGSMVHGTLHAFKSKSDARIPSARGRSGRYSSWNLAQHSAL